MDYIAGLVGFLGYEGLKIYKGIWDGSSFPPKDRIVIYLVSVLVIGLFSAFVAHIVASGNLGLAIYIGFSVPTSAKAILAPKSRKPSEANGIHVDDIALDGPGSSAKSSSRPIAQWYRIYFGSD
jgi:hypothetical protein